MSLDVQVLHDLVGDFQALLVNLIHQESLYLQATLVGRTPDEGQHSLEGAQWDAGPIDADGAKQTMLNRVPL